MSDPRVETLEIWRSNLFEIERRIAFHGGDTQTPLHLISLRDQARAEIEKLERDLAGSQPVSPNIVPSSVELSTQLDYRFQLENLRRDMASWQAAMSRELSGMTEEQVKPLQAMMFEMSRRLDAITLSLTTIQQDQAVIMHRLGALEMSSSSSDGVRSRWLVHLSAAILIVTVAILAGHYLRIGGL